MNTLWAWILHYPGFRTLTQSNIFYSIRVIIDINNFIRSNIAWCWHRILNYYFSRFLFTLGAMCFNCRRKTENTKFSHTNSSIHSFVREKRLWKIFDEYAKLGGKKASEGSFLIMIENLCGRTFDLWGRPWGECLVTP